MNLLCVLCALCVLCVEGGTQEDGSAREWLSLFNGKDLAGWERVGGGDADWAVEEDRLIGKGGKGGWLSTKDQYGDFELDLEYKVGPGGNSGIFLRSPREGHPWEVGLEIQLLDDDAAKHVNIKPWQHTGSVYGAIPPSKPAQKKAGEWNRIRIDCRQSRIVIDLNGERIVDADMSLNEKLKGRPRRGYIGLQDHGTRVEFRNIRLRPGDPDERK